MGIAKGLVDYQGRPWVIEQIERARLAVERVIVVLGHDAVSYEEALAVTDVALVRNHFPERGQFSSIQAGLSSIAPGTGAFVLPIDVPAASPAVWRALAAALPSGRAATVPMQGERGGHPVLLSASLVDEIRALPADGRLDEVLRSLPPAQRYHVPVDDIVVTMNLNDPATFRAYAALK